MTTTLKATIITGNLRDIDGCHSDSAIDSIVTAVEKAGKEFAEKHDVTVIVQRHISDTERMMQTIVVYGDTEGEAAYDGTTDRLCEDLSEHMDEAMGRAIEDGNWED